MSAPTKKWVRREYENTVLVAARKVRSLVFFWARQCRKSTNLGSVAFDEMSKEAGRTVIAASASLLVGAELIGKTMSATEQALLANNEAAAVQACMLANTAETNTQGERVKFTCANAETGKVYASLDAKDFSDLYKSGKLEMRLYHDRTHYSRVMVIAPNPATARGWTGTVVRDEAGFTPANMETELQIAVSPIIDADPTFKMIYASNLPRDDKHPFFEMTLPPVDVKLPVNPAGNFYRGQSGILVHRVTLADAYAAGHTLYDSNSGKALTLEQFRSKPSSKIQLPYNYDLEHVSGGSAALDLIAFLTSQKRGAESCAFVVVDCDADWRRALELLRDTLTGGTVGLGFDVATTTNEMSNPSSLTVTEQIGTERIQRLVAVWKEKKPQPARERMRDAVLAVQNRKAGGRARGLAIDASSEKYFAEETADILAPLIPVTLVVSGAAIQPPGYREKTNFKTYLGDLYSAAINENHYSLPSAAYFKKDQRSVIKDRGTYQCPVDPQDGGHGDTFDSGKLAEFALSHTRVTIGAVLI